jgi:hypothetical protein
MSIDYRKWLICALIGLATPLFIDQRRVYPDHACSVAEQVQADAWYAEVKNVRAVNTLIDTLLFTPRPRCVSAQQLSFFANRLPEAAQVIVSFSFLLSVVNMALFGFVLWPLARGTERLIRAAGQYITRKGRQIND